MSDSPADPTPDPDPAPRPTRTLRAWSAWWITGAVFLACALGIGSLVLEGTPLAAFAWTGLLALVAAVTWVLYGNPCVRLHPGGATVVNPVRTSQVPWSTVEAVELRLGVTLELVESARSEGRTRMALWALPTKGRRVRRDTTTRGRVEQGHPEVVEELVEAFRASRDSTGSDEPSTDGTGHRETITPEITHRWNVREIVILVIAGVWALAGMVLTQL
ncbi:hypothetical protein [Brevibacterium litoralis]|uniref:hypothetical protein n=1 Tax=Brevibacterium litoralis TaxID=3138935 RepID=UPI0032EED7B4